MNELTAGEQLFNTAQVADLLGIQQQTVRLWRHLGKGPRYVRLGGRYGRVLYRVSDVDRWLESRTFSSTSEEAVPASARGLHC